MKKALRMLCEINTANDMMRERLIYGAELVGEYDFPTIYPINADLRKIMAVPFNLAKKERNPKKAVCHFFIDDQKFERIWSHPEQYLEILRNFRYVCSPDFSSYDSMPKAMQIWQTYRSRAMGYWFEMNGISVIPTVGWGDRETYSWCFDGLPLHSTLAVSTNGCFSQEGRKCYQEGFHEMCKRLDPVKILVIGKEIPVEDKVDIYYLPSFGQTLTARIGR